LLTQHFQWEQLPGLLSCYKLLLRLLLWVRVLYMWALAPRVLCYTTSLRL
jgi:hypothetical protein